MRFHREVFGALLTLLLLQIIISVYGAAYLLAMPYQEKIYPGISVKGIPLQGMTREEASKLIESRVQIQMPQEVVLRKGDQTLRLNLQKAGVTFNPGDTAEKAYQLGREGGLPYRLLGFLRVSNRPMEIPVYLNLDEEKLEQHLAALKQERAKAGGKSDQFPDAESVRGALQTFFSMIYACDVVFI